MTMREPEVTESSRHPFSKSREDAGALGIADRQVERSARDEVRSRPRLILERLQAVSGVDTAPSRRELAHARRGDPILEEPEYKVSASRRELASSGD